MRSRSRRSTAIAAAAAAALGTGAAGTIAYAPIPAADGTIHACRAVQDPLLSLSLSLGGTAGYQKGDVRVVEEGEGCRSYEAPLSWNQTGEPGSAGPAGQAGPPGAAGPAGAPGPQRPAGIGTIYSKHNGHERSNGRVELVVPAGTYLVLGKGEVHNAHDTVLEAFCRLSTGDAAIPGILPHRSTMVALQDTTTVTASTTITLDCLESPESLRDFGLSLTAIKVDAINP